MDSSRVQRFLNLFAAIGELYQTNDSDPTWDKYPQALSNRAQSLAVFLDGYAFERSGRPPKFSVIAARIIAQKRSDDLDPTSVWSEFSLEFGGKGINPKVNPLAPKGTEFRHKGATLRTTGLSVIELERTLGKPLAKWVVDNLLNTPKIVHDRLREISGVGEKIASFFMRDIACRFNVFPLRAEDRHLLQPVDIWIERAATCLGAPAGRAAEFLVRWSGADGNRPERVNQGIWLFGAEVVRSQEMLERFLCTTNGMDEVMSDLKAQIAHRREILNRLESALGADH
jgi:hypothetical protein